MNYKFSVVLFINFICSGGCMVKGLAKRMVGGFQLDIQAAPYQVAVIRNQDLLCGGTILNENYILTAKKCAPLNATDLSIRAGSARYQEEGTVKKVSETLLHPSADIALLKLYYPLKLDNKTMSALAVASEGVSLDIGTEAFVAGWGSLEEDGVTSRLLHGALVKVMKCKVPSTTTLCAGFPEGGVGACTFDAGGALVYEKVAYGVLSQYQCGTPGEPDLYTRVAAFKNWIEENSS